MQCHSSLLHPSHKTDVQKKIHNECLQDDRKEQKKRNNADFIDDYNILLV
jgi:hypothetical protein